MSFEKFGDFPDVFYLGEFEHNHVFSRRISGNPPPSNQALGALVLDVDQAALLLQVIEEYEKAYQIERKGQTMLNHAHDSLSCLHAILCSATFEPAV